MDIMQVEYSYKLIDTDVRVDVNMPTMVQEYESKPLRSRQLYIYIYGYSHEVAMIVLR